MNCIKCGAPLEARTDVCRHCGTLNDSDLRKLYDADVSGVKETDRICPRCNINLQTIKVVYEKNFYIERCKNCLGIFFDPFELEDLISTAINENHKLDNKKLRILIEEGKRDEWPIKYIECPVCGQHMQRKTFGGMSGVVIDWCRSDGIWLDGGELGKLLRWARSGGTKRKGEFKKIKKQFETTFKKFAIRKPHDPAGKTSFSSGRKPKAKEEVRIHHIVVDKKEEDNFLAGAMKFFAGLFG